MPNAAGFWQGNLVRLQRQWHRFAPNFIKLGKGMTDPYIRLTGSNEGARLSAELSTFYKIKLKALGYRLVYEVIDHRLVVVVIAVGRRENNSVYTTARARVVQ